MDEGEQRLGVGEALGLAIPLALGGALATAGAIGAVGSCERLAGAKQVPLAVSALLLAGLAGWVGTGLARLDPLRRWVAIGLALAASLALGWGTRGQPSVAGPLLGTGVAFALATPGVARWFEPGAVAARGVSIGPFVAAVVGLELVLGALAVVTHAFGRLIRETGFQTDRVTDVVLALSALVVEHGAWLVPLLLLAATPLLTLPRRRAGAVIGAVLLATLVGLGHAIGAPLLFVLLQDRPGKL